MPAAFLQEGMRNHSSRSHLQQSKLVLQNLLFFDQLINRFLFVHWTIVQIKRTLQRSWNNWMAPTNSITIFLSAGMASGRCASIKLSWSERKRVASRQSMEELNLSKRGGAQPCSTIAHTNKKCFCFIVFRILNGRLCFIVFHTNKCTRIDQRSRGLQITPLDSEVEWCISVIILWVDSNVDLEISYIMHRHSIHGSKSIPSIREFSHRLELPNGEASVFQRSRRSARYH